MQRVVNAENQFGFPGDPNVRFASKAVLGKRRNGHPGTR